MSSDAPKAQLTEILDYLCKKDSNFHLIAVEINLPSSRNLSDGFSLLVETIISQQLSNKAAETIFERFLDRHNLSFGFQPVDLVATQQTIRECGVSNAKSNFILSIQDELILKSDFFHELSVLSDKEVESQLVKLKGVGVWTARILMISLYGRLDVFPYNDGTLVKAINLMGYNSSKSIEDISSAWSPYRSVAARLLWNAYDSELLKDNDVK